MKTFHLILQCVLIALLFKSIVTSLTAANTKDIVVIPAATRTLGNLPSFIQAQSFHSRFQTRSRFDLSTVSDSFVKVPGLTFVFSHSTPMLYKINFQGTCTNYIAISESYMHILVDDKVFIFNKLLPNDNSRLSLGQDLDDTLSKIDALDAGYFGSHTIWQWTPCVQYKTIYLAAGVHSIDVGVRTTKQFSVYGGQLTVELVQYNSNSSINLPIINT